MWLGLVKDQWRLALAFRGPRKLFSALGFDRDANSNVSPVSCEWPFSVASVWASWGTLCTTASVIEKKKMVMTRRAQEQAAWHYKLTSWDHCGNVKSISWYIYIKKLFSHDNFFSHHVNLCYYISQCNRLGAWYFSSGTISSGALKWLG